MARQILIPLRRGDSTEKFMPYIERIAQPGKKVVFLMRYPVYGFIWPRNESGIGAAKELEAIAAYYTWDAQKRLAEKRISVARKALEKRGVEVGVDVYTQDLRTAVETYTRSGDAHLIVMRAGIALRIMEFLRRMASVFGLLKQSSSSPELVFHPGTLL